MFDAVAGERIFIGTEPGYDRERKRAQLSATLADGERTVLIVAHAGASIVGQLSVFSHEEFGPTIGMMVYDRWRGRGIGRMLLDAAVAWASERGLRALSLLVFPHNDRAIALYRTAGFVEIERFPADVTRQSGEVWDTILMRKELA
jgi:GNAT superfamily N-acetyltransferase